MGKTEVQKRLRVVREKRLISKLREKERCWQRYMSANGLIQQRLRVNLLSIQLLQEVEFPSNLRAKNPFSCRKKKSLTQFEKELPGMKHCVFCQLQLTEPCLLPSLSL